LTWKSQTPLVLVIIETGETGAYARAVDVVDVVYFVNIPDANAEVPK
jgi:hypothetical protein